jgi:hypothetical protein
MSAGRPASGEVRLPHQHLPPAGLYQGSSPSSGAGADSTRAGLCRVDPNPVGSNLFGQVDRCPDARIRAIEVRLLIKICF